MSDQKEHRFSMLFVVVVVVLTCDQMQTNVATNDELF